MKKLRNKTFITIFTIISTFLIIGLIIVNVQNYNREYENIKRNLTMIGPMVKRDENKFREPDIDNMMIMDYEVYTIKLKDNKIDRIINHGNNTNLDIDTIANNIINKNNSDKLQIGNLYLNKYSYNLKYNDVLLVINTKDINHRLTNLLIYSLIIFMLSEVIIAYLSQRITIWITKPAIEAFKKQKEFIEDASHELKTPLAIIMASSDELKEDKKNKKYIDNIKYETERMNKLITSLLDLSKLENAVTIGAYHEENISKIIEKVALTFESIAYENDLSIKTDIEDDIIFNCNKDEIERLIAIIVDNAIKHSTKKTTIEINTHKIKNNINIEISNIGEGIKPGDEEKIFERFYRADKSRNRSENRYGLGLAIAKNIVINHGGIIEAFSKGMPAISTSIGAEGLEYIDGETIIIADDKDDFKIAIKTLTDKQRQKDIGEKAREIYDKNYSPEAIEELLCQAVLI